MELHGEGKASKTVVTEEGGDSGTKVVRTGDSFEPPVQESV